MLIFKIINNPNKKAFLMPGEKTVSTHRSFFRNRKELPRAEPSVTKSSSGSVAGSVFSLATVFLSFLFTYASLLDPQVNKKFSITTV